MANFDNLINDNQHANTIGDNPARAGLSPIVLAC